MKHYRYQLMTGGVLLMLLGHQPLMAVEDSQFSAHSLEYESIGDKQQDAMLPKTPSLLEKLTAELAKQESNSQSDPSSIMATELSESKSTPSSPFLAQIPNYSPGTPTYSQAPGQTFQAPSPAPIRPSGSNPEVLVPNPEVIIRSNGSSIPDSLQPTMPVAPTLPRAIAPPVGDMAISNIDAGASQIDLGSSVIVPRLVLREAPAREVLAVLARFAGMNLVFTDTPGGGQGQGQDAAEATVSLDLENEPVEDVFNAVLMISGLQANRRGRTVFVGSQLPQAARTLVSRTIRLNQVESSNAGVFLASQGAEFQRLITQTEDIIDPLTQRVVGRRELPSSLESLTSAAGDAASGPMLLKGLTVSSDDRLNTITLVGEPRDVQVATSLLTQMDARRRQVAVNVKVVDVTLTNDQSFSSSFSFNSGDTFVVQDDGTAILRFGGFSPASGADLNSAPGRVINPPVIPNPLNGSNIFLDFDRSIVAPGQGVDGTDAIFFGSEAGISIDPSITGITEITPGGFSSFVDGNFIPGDPAEAIVELPSFFQFPQRFLAQIETTISSGNAKVLTDPTLVVQEGQQATVRLTQKVIENITTQVDPLSGVRTTTPDLQDAGLTLTIDVDKIDDNGYINLTVSPTIASPGAQEVFDSGTDGGTNVLTLLQRRELSSGLIRLRDGQTLILSGIIQETDQSVVSKVPLLGDIPLLGALFRSQIDTSDRTEVIVLLTPQILHDSGQWGYNYQPGRGTAEVLRDQGFPVQLVP